MEEIGQPELDLNIADEFDTEEDLGIAKGFLEVFQRYESYYNETDQWTVSDDHKCFTAWSRNDGRFIVRKAEISTDVDLKVFEEIMTNLNMAPKWNPILGKIKVKKKLYIVFVVILAII